MKIKLNLIISILCFSFANINNAYSVEIVNNPKNAIILGNTQQNLGENDNIHIGKKTILSIENEVVLNKNQEKENTEKSKEQKIEENSFYFQYLNENKNRFRTIKEDLDNYVKDLVNEKDLAYKNYKEQKEIKENKRELFITLLKELATNKKDDFIVREYGFPFTYKPIYIYKNILIETDVAGTVQVFKDENFLSELLKQWENNEYLKYHTFDEVIELAAKNKLNKNELTLYRKIKNDFKEQQSNIIAIDFNKRPELKRNLTSLLNENSLNRQQIFSTIMSLKWVIVEKNEIDKEQKLFDDVNNLLGKYNKN